MEASTYLVRHAKEVHNVIDVRAESLRVQFEAIETLDFHPTFDDACTTLKADLLKLVRK